MDKDELQLEMLQVVEHYKEELAQIQTGRATPELLEEIKVEAYETTQPLKNIANLAISDAQSLVVTAWDANIVEDISKAISAANLGLGVSIEGASVRVTVPSLSEDRRKEYVKVAGDRAETARVSVRNVRQAFMKKIDQTIAGGISEDVGEVQKKEVEKQVQETNKIIDECREKKEKVLMKV